MGTLIALDPLLRSGRVWRGEPAAVPVQRQPTGLDALDAALPMAGWPEAALTEILLPADGVGELALVLPTLARLTRTGQDIALIGAPYLPYPAAWMAADVDFAKVQLIDAPPREALWATEQCLRSGSLGAVLCWSARADDRALRRLQVAAETGQTLGFAFRDRREARNASPAALRLLLETTPAQVRVLKCRGGNPPAQPIPFPGPWH